MKKHLIAAAVAASVTLPAMAQVTLSGGISVGYMNANTAATSTGGIAHLGNGANAINLSAAEDLGGGMRAGWDGQIRYNAASGDMNSNGANATGDALFHNANFFLSGSFGTVRMGRIAEESNCGFDPWGCRGGAAMSGGIGLSNESTAATEVRNLIGAGSQAKSVYYQTPLFNGFRLSYQQSVTGPLEATRQNERSIANLTYNEGPISAAYIQARNGGNTSGQTADTAGTAAADTVGDQTAFAVRYNFGFAQIGGQRVTVKNSLRVRTSAVSSVHAIVPMGGPWTMLFGYANDSLAAQDFDTKTSLGADYALSKRTILGADVFQQKTLAGSTGFVIRARHSF